MFFYREAKMTKHLFGWLVWAASWTSAFSHEVAFDPNEFPSMRFPVDLAISPDGSRAVVVCHNNSIAVINLQSGKYEIANIGSNLWPGKHPLKAVFIGSNCFVINEYSEFITEFDPVTLRIVANHPAPMYCQNLLYDEIAGVVYITNKWLDEVLVYNQSFQPQRSGIRVGRNPGPLALSSDRQRLYVGNAGSWNISVIDLNTNTVVDNIYLGSAPTALAATPQAIVATNHGGRNLKKINGAPLIENDQTDLVNVVTFIDQASGIPADHFIDAGADYSDLRIKDGLMVFAGAADGSVHLYRLNQPMNTIQALDMLDPEWGLVGGRNGPRGSLSGRPLAVAIKDGQTIYTLHYFRDSVVEIKHNTARNRFEVTKEIPLNALGVVITAFVRDRVNLNDRQNGERYFTTVGAWKRGQRDFSCATCHPNGHSDFRFIVDQKDDPFKPGSRQGPEKHPSAISTNMTAPFAWEGKAATLFEFNKEALDAHDIQDGTGDLHADVAEFMALFEALLRPEPNPYPAANGDLQNPNAAQRGKSVFVAAGCFGCHSGGAFTDRLPHEVGTGRKLDTPSLVQLWDKAPYLHDGRAETLAQLLDPATYEAPEAHGKLAPLTAAQKEDLSAYLLAIRLGDIPTRVDDPNGEMPVAFALKPNYPNPFNPETYIDYQIPATSRVDLGIYNGLGQKVRTLVEAKQATGRYQIKWDGKNESGFPLPSGVYLYRLRVEGSVEARAFVQTNKMLLLR